MKSVRVSKATLLEVLKKNRSEHRRIFEEACAGFRAEAIKCLEQQLAEAKAGRRIKSFVGLQQPVDQTREYDQAIRACEMSVDETIELSEADFACYVMDNWAWRDNFVSTNAMYSATARSMQER